MANPVTRFTWRLVSGVLDFIFEGRVWKEFLTYRVQAPDDTQAAKYGALRAAGVRCKTQVMGNRGGYPYGAAASSNEMVIILVHRDDLHKARQALSQMGDGRT